MHGPPSQAALRTRPEDACAAATASGTGSQGRRSICVVERMDVGGVAGFSKGILLGDRAASGAVWGLKESGCSCAGSGWREPFTGWRETQNAARSPLDNRPRATGNGALAARGLDRRRVSATLRRAGWDWRGKDGGAPGVGMATTSAVASAARKWKWLVVRRYRGKGELAPALRSLLFADDFGYTTARCRKRNPLACRATVRAAMVRT